MELKGRYAVVTTTSSFRQRYVIPLDELQKENEEVQLDMPTTIEWAQDSVTCEEVKEFSQSFLGEQIIDTFILDEERMLQLFDRDNKYLSEGPDAWDTERKLKFIRDWKEKNLRSEEET